MNRLQRSLQSQCLARVHPACISSRSSQSTKREPFQNPVPIFRITTNLTLPCLATLSYMGEINGPSFPHGGALRFSWLAVESKGYRMLILVIRISYSLTQPEKIANLGPRDEYNDIDIFAMSFPEVCILFSQRCSRSSSVIG